MDILDEHSDSFERWKSMDKPNKIEVVKKVQKVQKVHDEIYPSLTRLSITFIGMMDTIFGVIILMVSLQKSVFGIDMYLFIILSWAGGISLLIVARQSNINEINNALKIGNVLGLLIGIVYLYFIIKTLSRGI